MTATVHLISQSAFDAAICGELKNFELSTDMASLDLDKSWHAIHYLVTGDCSLNFLLSGKQVAGIGELFEVHSPHEISELSNVLKTIPISQIMAKYDPCTFDELNIYGGPGWDSGSVDYIKQHLEKFIEFLDFASDKGFGFAVSIPC